MWRILYDWQALAAGLLAFCAGILAFYAGVVQAQALGAQVVELKRQNDDRNATETRRVAIETVRSATMFDGVLAGVESNFDTAGSVGGDPDARVGQCANTIRERIKPAPYSEALIHLASLASLARECAGDFHYLCESIERFRLPGGDVTIATFNKEVAEVKDIIHSLRDKVATQMREAEKTLSAVPR